MNRRDFMGGSLGAMLVASGMASGVEAADAPDDEAPAGTRGTKLTVRPVMTNIVHTAPWEGPCRWTAVPVSEEKARTEASFAGWSQQVAKQLGPQPGIELLPPVHVTFAEDFKLAEGPMRQLVEDADKTDVLYIAPSGSSIAACQIGERVGKPFIVRGLSCRTVDILAYARSVGQEAFVPAHDDELRQLLDLLRARKVCRQTSVLLPTDRGMPAVASVSGVNNLVDLEKRLGIRVVQIPYSELAAAMDQTLASEAERKKAEAIASDLIRNACQSHIDKDYVTRSVQFHHTITGLMGRHKCNAFTIECFEFCSSRLPEKWKITPCLIHTLLKDRGYASSCEADLGALVSMRLLMSVSGKSSHLGNTFLRPNGSLAINHSAPGMKMNGYDQAGLPYKLGRFVDSGWGTKVVVDFMDNEEKSVTVVRLDPTATKMLILKGKLVGSNGWDGDNLGCSVEAQVVPLEGKAEDFVRKQTDYGNHLIWVYGDYANQMQQLGKLLDLQVDVVG